MVVCAECHSVYLDPRPDPVSLSLAYAEHYYTHDAAEPDGYLTQGGWIAKTINGYLAWRFGMNRQPCWPIGAWVIRMTPPLRLKLDVYGRHIPLSWKGDHDKSLLDIGSGNGNFLLRTKEMGFKALGVEPDPLAVKSASALGLDVLDGDAFHSGLDGRCFDYITLNHVIEHVEDPLSLLRRVHELLFPGGRIWLALPNPEACSLKYFKEGWKGFHPPFHLQIPSQRMLVHWLKSCGYTDIRSVCRGSASPGFWRESHNIAQRERIKHKPWLNALTRFGVSLMGTFSPRWGDETIVIARRPPLEK